MDGSLGVPEPTSVGIVGHSRGGGIAILAAANNTDYAALVTWAAISHVNRWSPEQVASWRASGQIDIVNARTGQVLPMLLDTLEDVERNGAGSLDVAKAASAIRVPWLLIHGQADEAVPGTEAERLAALSTSPDFELVTLEGAGHTFGAAHPWAGTNPTLDQVFDRSVNFLALHLD